MPVDRFQSAPSDSPPGDAGAHGNGKEQTRQQADPQAQQRASGGYRGAEALDEFRQQADELVELAGLYLSARLDGLKASLRQLALLAGLGVVAVLAAAGVTITCLVLGLLGIAQLIGETLERPWAGYLITGFGLLAALGTSLAVGYWIFVRRQRERTIKRYEQRRQQERARFGHDLTQPAQRRPE